MKDKLKNLNCISVLSFSPQRFQGRFYLILSLTSKKMGASYFMLKQINNQKNYTYSPYQNYYLMSSIWGYKTFIRITTDERGLLFKNGNYKKVLRPGKYLFFPLMGYRVRKMNVNQNFITEKNLNIYLDDKRLLEELLVSDIKDYEIALHYEDGHFTEILVPGKYAFWKVLKNHQII